MVVAPMQEISPRESAGLRMLAASSEPSADPAPISEWISSMKMMMSVFSFSSLILNRITDDACGLRLGEAPLHAVHLP